jgi:hypothetical protein
MFTRTFFCEKCNSNKLPYTNPADVLRKHLQFLVVGQHHTDEVMYRVREQSKTAIIGYTPHLFFIESVDDNFFEMTYACGVHGCDTEISVDARGYRHAQVHNNKILYMDRAQVIGLLSFKDIKYMLDFKEDQWVYHPSIFYELSPY